MNDISINASDDGVVLTVPLDLVRGRVLRAGDLRVAMAPEAALGLFEQLSDPKRSAHAACTGEWTARHSEDGLFAIALEAWGDGSAIRSVYVHLDGAGEAVVAFDVTGDEARVLYERVFWSAVPAASA